MSPLLFCGFLTATLSLASGMWDVVVPAGLGNADGNASSRVPFAYLSPVHYQQVYDASAFTNIPPDGAFITLIRLRPDCTSVRGWFVSNVVMRLSTTTNAPDQLSPSFPANYGSDQVVTFTSAQFGPPSDAVGCPSSFDASQPFRLSVPFFYSPSKGNLLLDLQHDGIRWTGGLLSESLTDAHEVGGDSVSRIVAFSASAEDAEIVDSMGMVTHFQFYSAPTLTNEIRTNSLLLTWAGSPSTFRLQWSDTLGNQNLWAYYPGTVVVGGVYHYASIPLSTLAREKYFRLFWDTPQPLENHGE